jgi:hypothetical protein
LFANGVLPSLFNGWKMHLINPDLLNNCGCDVLFLNSLDQDQMPSDLASDLDPKYLTLPH